MNITIVGAGQMARGIGTRMVAGGNSVTLLNRDPEEGAALAAELQAGARNGATVQAAPFGSSLREEVVILAVPYTAEPEIIQQYHAQLPGKILVNISNPLNATYDGLATPPGSSDAEETAKLVPTGTRVVKAFNTTFARTLITGQVAGQPLDVFIAGDDAAAKATISQLVKAGGLRAIDVGPLSRARQLEGMGFLGITLQGPLGTQFMSAWKLLFP
jgi:8-hydroxy-5-deazaflavin:NADPH oxidoreductase